MRSIKFRAWDIVEKKMINNLQDRYGMSADLKCRNHIIMQYTGLKDKKRTEIWEGDIITVVNPKCQRQKKRLVGVVEFSYASFRYKLARVDVWEHYTAGTNPEIGEIYPFLNIADFTLVEVIGNIHGNPEMLK